MRRVHGAPDARHADRLPTDGLRLDARTAERTAFAVVAARGTIAEAARGAFAAIRAAFKAARRHASARVTTATLQTDAAHVTSMAALRHQRRRGAALAANPRRASPPSTRRALNASPRRRGAVAAPHDRAGTLAVALRGAVATIRAPSNRRGRAASPSRLPARRAFATITATFKPTRRALTLIPTWSTITRAFKPARRTTRALATRRPIRRRAVRATRVPLARKRSFSPCRTRVVRHRPAYRRPPAACRRRAAPAPSPRAPLGPGVAGLGPAGRVGLRADVLPVRTGARSDEAGRGCLAVNLTRMKSHTAIARSSSVST